MTLEEQIAAIRTTLSTVETAIAQTRAALRVAEPGDEAALTAALANLEAERSQLKLRLVSLEAALVTVAPLGGAEAGTRSATAGAARRNERTSARGAVRTRALARKLAKATLKLSVDVSAVSRALLMFGDDTTKPKPKR